MTWLRSHRRYTGNHRRCGRTYNFRRHRTAVRTPYRRRHAAYRTGKSMETPANIHPYFCSGISFAANRLHRAMVLFRMEQSDTCRVHPMGRNSLSGTSPQSIYDHTRPCRLHGRSMRKLHTVRTLHRRIRAECRPVTGDRDSNNNRIHLPVFRTYTLSFLSIHQSKNRLLTILWLL